MPMIDDDDNDDDDDDDGDDGYVISACVFTTYKI